MTEPAKVTMTMTKQEAIFTRAALVTAAEKAREAWASERAKLSLYGPLAQEWENLGKECITTYDEAIAIVSNAIKRA